MAEERRMEELLDTNPALAEMNAAPAVRVETGVESANRRGMIECGLRDYASPVAPAQCLPDAGRCIGASHQCVGAK